MSAGGGGGGGIHCFKFILNWPFLVLLKDIKF